jgi:hypothetical protein
MDVMQTVFADGYEFAFIVGGATGFGIPFNSSWPEEVGLPLAHLIYVPLKVIIGVYRSLLRELLVA